MKVLNNFEKIWAYHWEKMQRNHDRVIAISGGEGKGKSRGLFLPSLEFWYELQDRPVPKNRYGVHISGFKEAFVTGKKYDFVGLDEAGDIMQKQDYRDMFNSAMYKAYTVIRERLLLTVLVMPSFFDLPKGFRARRIHGLFHVHKRVDNKCKRCAKFHIKKTCPGCGCRDFHKGYIIWRYFNRKNLDKIISRNKYRTKFSVNVGAEYIEGRMYEYKGPLIKDYEKRKASKMESALHIFKNVIQDLGDLENVRKCPNCGTRDFRYIEKLKKYKCRCCPMRWKPSAHEVKRIKKLGGGKGAI